MAFLFNVNNVVVSQAESLFDMIEDMITQGWLIVGSGDGLAAFENTGQTAGLGGGGSGGGFHVFTTGGSGALGMDNGSDFVNGAWVRIKAPVGSNFANLEYLWSRDTTSNDWRLMASVDGTGFDSGGAAAVSPVAADQVSLAGNQVRQASSADFRTWIPSGGGVHDHWAVGDASEDYGFVMFNLRVSDEGVWGVWGLDPCGSLPPGSSPPVTIDPLPFVHLMSHASGSGSSFDAFDTATLFGWYFPTGGSAERIEDMVGANGPDRGVFAHFGFGESGPPAFAGLYSVAPMIGGQGGAGERWTQSVGPDLTSTKQVHLAAAQYIRCDISNTTNFYKGTGRLLGHTRESTAQVDDDGTEARFKRSGTSVPWPLATGFIL